MPLIELLILLIIIIFVLFISVSSIYAQDFNDNLTIDDDEEIDDDRHCIAEETEGRRSALLHE